MGVEEGAVLQVDGLRLRYDRRTGASPGVVFLGGFASNRQGRKARAVWDHCGRSGRACVCFDYRGHGDSEGLFEEATVGAWIDDAVAVLDRLTEGPQVLVGSSMGAWVAAALLERRPRRIAGLVTVAAAPDFTERLLAPRLPPEAWEAFARGSPWRLPSAFVEGGIPLGPRFVTEAREHVLLGKSLAWQGSAQLLHGLDDADVPWQTSVELARALASAHAAVELVAGGDHMLSRPEDLERLCRRLEEVCGAA
jgi:pimeloyl-ACP methyl ester carboxylesterase